MAGNDGVGSFITGFLFGGIVGAVVGILMTPRTGSETRTELAQQSELWKEWAEDLAVKVKEQLGPAADTFADTLIDTIGPSVDLVRGKVVPVSEAVGDIRKRTVRKKRQDMKVVEDATMDADE